MKVSTLKSCWIIFYSLLATLITSLKVLYYCLIGVESVRKKLDLCLYQWSIKLLKITKTKLRVFNPHHVQLEPHQRYVLMSNHSSNFDIPLIYMIFKNASIRMMTKKELFKVPIWGSAMRKGEFISVDRGNGRQAIKDLKNAREKLESGVTIWVSPEGTRSRTGILLPFKKGGFMLAKKTDAIIIPIGIKGANKVLPAKSLQFNLNQLVEIHVGKPIDSTTFDKKDLTPLMEEVRNQIEWLIK